MKASAVGCSAEVDITAMAASNFGQRILNSTAAMWRSVCGIGGRQSSDSFMRGAVAIVSELESTVVRPAPNFFRHQCGHERVRWIQQKIRFLRDNDGWHLRDQLRSRFCPDRTPVERYEAGRQRIPTYMQRDIELRSRYPRIVRDLNFYQIAIERQRVRAAQVHDGFKTSKRHGRRGVDERCALSVPSTPGLLRPFARQIVGCVIGGIGGYAPHTMWHSSRISPGLLLR